MDNLKEMEDRLPPESKRSFDALHTHMDLCEDFMEKALNMSLNSPTSNHDLLLQVRGALRALQLAINEAWAVGDASKTILIELAKTIKKM